MLSILLAAAWLMLAYCAGFCALRALGLDFRGPKAIIFSTALGFSFSSLAGFALAATGRLDAPSVAAVAAVCAALTAPGWGQAFRALKEAASGFGGFAKDLPSSRYATALAALLAFLIVLQAAVAFAPPAARPAGPSDWDSLTYHFTIARVYAESHGFSFIPSIPHSNWAIASETAYAVTFAIDGVVLAKLLSLCLGILLLAAVFSFSREMLSVRGSLTAVAILASMPALQNQLGTGYIDTHLALFTLLGTWVLFDHFEKQSAARLALAAAFFGAAAATKSVGAYALAIALMAVCWKALFGKAKPEAKTASSIAKTVAIFALVSAAFFAPYYAKTYHFTGNPVWPLYSPALGLIGVSPAGTEYFNAVLSRDSAASGWGRELWKIPLLPFSATLDGKSFNDIITPLLLGFLPLAMLAGGIPRRARLGAAFGAALLAAWFFSYQEARFAFAPLALLSIAAAAGFDAVKDDSVLGRHAKAAVVLVLAFAAAYALAYKHAALPSALGLESHDAYLRASTPDYPAIEWANENLPQGARVYFVWDQHAFYLERAFEYSVYEDFSGFSSAAQLRAFLRSKGVTHLLVDWKRRPAADSRLSRMSELFGELLKNQDGLLYSGNGVSLYRLD